MCGRLAQTTDLDQLLASFGATIPTEEQKRDPTGPDTRPTQRIAAIALGKDGARKLVFPHWGMIGRDAERIPNTINARAENVPRNNMWRPLFEGGRRCLIPFDAFYEWQTIPDPEGRKSKAKKVPHTIRVRSNRAYAFPGLYSTWRPKSSEVGSPEASAVDLCTTIITTEANTAILPLHQRMPVILVEDDFPAWLGERKAEPEQLAALLRPCPAEMTEVAPGGPFG